MQGLISTDFDRAIGLDLPLEEERRARDRAEGQSRRRRAVRASAEGQKCVIVERYSTVTES